MFAFPLDVGRVLRFIRHLVWFLIHQLLRANLQGGNAVEREREREGGRGRVRRKWGKTRIHGNPVHNRYIFVTMAPPPPPPPWRQSPFWGYLCAQANEQRERQRRGNKQSEARRRTARVVEEIKGTAIRRRTCQFSLQTKAKRFAPAGVWAQIATPPLSLSLTYPFKRKPN